jgi:hypothetical protein
MKTWVYEPSVDVWWTNIALARGQHRKVITLISWEVWKERNTRVFRHHQYIYREHGHCQDHR